MNIFDQILINPFFNGLIGIYHILPGQDMGVAIIVLTLVVRLLLATPSAKSISAQRELQLLQPKLDELKEKYKNNREELGRKLMEFYSAHKVNPFSSCLPTLIQLPIIYALYRVFISGLTVDPETGQLVADQVARLYDGLRDIYASTPLHTTAFGFLDLTATGNIALALITGGLQFWQSRMLVARRAPIDTKGAKDENMAANFSKQMMYLFPIITAYFAYLFPAGLALYWLTSTVFQVVQQYIVFRRVQTPKELNDASPSQT